MGLRKPPLKMIEDSIEPATHSSTFLHQLSILFSLSIIFDVYVKVDFFST